jgi:ESCRT-II complex subunit VPS25
MGSTDIRLGELDRIGPPPAPLTPQIIDTGQTGSILTFYELTEGDLAETTEFRNLHPTILRKALDGLAKKGKAQVIKGDEGSADGVRFFA